jgi:hypothetical protein
MDLRDLTDALDPLEDALDQLGDALDQLAARDPSELAGCETIESLFGSQARLEALVTTATAAFEASGAFVPSGARTVPHWLTVRCHVATPRGRRILRRGRTLRSLPGFSQAWSDGDITVDQVDTVLAVATPATEEALARDEALLVDQATTLRPDQFARAVQYWAQLADPDGTESDDEATRARRDVSLDESFEGMFFGTMTLDPITGTIVAEELARLEQCFFEDDWAGAHRILGRDPQVHELARTPGQRRADALAEMATRSQMAPADGRRPAPLFTVLVDYPTLHGRICELASGTILAPGALLAWLDQAYLERVVFSPGQRIEVSATARLFTGATRRAIELRDRECTQAYCDVPAARCQVDHRIPHRAGGPTTQENGQLLCGPHNRLREQHPTADDGPHLE